MAAMAPWVQQVPPCCSFTEVTKFSPSTSLKSKDAGRSLLNAPPNDGQIIKKITRKGRRENTIFFTCMYVPLIFFMVIVGISDNIKRLRCQFISQTGETNKKKIIKIKKLDGVTNGKTSVSYFYQSSSSSSPLPFFFFLLIIRGAILTSNPGLRPL